MGTIFGGFTAEVIGQVILQLRRKERTLLPGGKLAGVQVVRSRRGKLAAVQFVVFE